MTQWIDFRELIVLPSPVPRLPLFGLRPQRLGRAVGQSTLLITTLFSSASCTGRRARFLPANHAFLIDAPGCTVMDFPGNAHCRMSEPLHRFRYPREWNSTFVPLLRFSSQHTLASKGFPCSELLARVAAGWRFAAPRGEARQRFAVRLCSHPGIEHEGPGIAGCGGRQSAPSSVPKRHTARTLRNSEGDA